MKSQAPYTCFSKKNLNRLGLTLVVCSVAFFLSDRKGTGSEPSANIHAERETISSSDQSAIGNKAERSRGVISVAQATAIAVNKISTQDEGVQLTHPRHVVDFDRDGLTFSPRLGGPVWKWQNDSDGQVTPTQKEGPSPGVHYSRGGVTEEYLARVDCVEQRFILHDPQAADFVVSGLIACEGAFEEHPQGWLWRSENGEVVSLGGVTVFDAEGTKLPATMTVTEQSTEIFVSGEALAMASFPVTVDPEIGTNDFRVSNSVDDFARYFQAVDPDVAYNSTQDEYLVIWRADGVVGNRLLNEYEIFGQRIDATTGELKGTPQFVISDTFDDGDTNSVYPRTPVVAYNSVADEYFAIWTTAFSEIRGQRLAGDTGANIGDDFIINDDDDDGTGSPDVEFSPESNCFFIVWSGYQETGGLIRNEFEIFGRFVSGTGLFIGDTIRISDMGPDGNGSYDALFPRIAYSDGGRFLVVWEGDDLSGALDNGEQEIFGQFVDAGTRIETGPNDFRISSAGADGNTSVDAGVPSVAFDPERDQFLVVWEADTGTGGLASNENEIYGQFIADVTGLEMGQNDFRISSFGNNDGTSADSAINPEVIYQAEEDAFVVAWSAAENVGGGTREDEIFAQVIDAVTGAALGANTRMSDMGPDGDDSFGPSAPFALASGSADRVFFTWSGNDDQFDLFPEEAEIFIQLGRVDGGLIEEGANDFKISEAGSDGDNISDAFVPALVYNSSDDCYLVVWENPGAGGAFALERIFGNRIDGSSGVRLHEDDFVIDQSTGGGSAFGENQDPAAAYNEVNNEFLVVWAGFGRNDDDFSGAETEIFVRRMNAASGEFLSDETRISDVGTRGNTRIDGANPDVAYDAIHNQYLVVWESDSDTGSLVNNEFEIYGQHLNGVDAAEMGLDDFRISVTSAEGNADRDATNPAVAFNGVDFMVVWQADAGSVDDKYEIYGRRYSGETGFQVPTLFTISETGSSSNASRFAENPAICASLDAEADNGFLVVWQADLASQGDVQIHGRYYLESAPGASSMFTISELEDAAGINPACAYDPVSGNYIVVWETLPYGAGDSSEIRGQLLASVSGDLVGTTNFLLSDMGPDNDPDFNAHTPMVGVNSSNGNFFTTWSGDDDQNGGIEEEFEIFGQFYGSGRPEIVELIISRANIVVRFRGEENTTYQLQSSLDLESWENQGSQLVATGGTDGVIHINGAVGPKNFWRVIPVTE
ncbi:hypothetical protein N9F48_02975 [Akkermansiaceae bacterium]|nr:hypothetical protein [Akkermansiaceae bacterium]MDB4504864.1 hypothetical protein [Akkermansiaceae bacterium]